MPLGTLTNPPVVVLRYEQRVDRTRTTPSQQSIASSQVRAGKDLSQVEFAVITLAVTTTAVLVGTTAAALAIRGNAGWSKKDISVGKCAAGSTVAAVAYAYLLAFSQRSAGIVATTCLFAAAGVAAGIGGAGVTLSVAAGLTTTDQAQSATAFAVRGLFTPATCPRLQTSISYAVCSNMN